MIGIDVVWQVTATASVAAFTALGFLLRRMVARMDRRLDERRNR